MEKKILVLSFIMFCWKNSKTGIFYWSLFVYCSAGISLKCSLLDGLYVFPNHCVYQMGYHKEDYFHLLFFNVFIDVLSVWLRSVSVVCYIGDTCMSHMTDIAAQFINEKELVSNMKKTKCKYDNPANKIILPEYYYNIIFCCV